MPPDYEPPAIPPSPDPETVPTPTDGPCLVLLTQTTEATDTAPAIWKVQIVPDRDDTGQSVPTASLQAFLRHLGINGAVRFDRPVTHLEVHEALSVGLEEVENLPGAVEVIPHPGEED